MFNLHHCWMLLMLKVICHVPTLKFDLSQYDSDSQNHISNTNAMVALNDKFMPPQNRQDNYPALDAVLTCGATWPCPGMPNITICAPDIF